VSHPHRAWPRTSAATGELATLTATGEHAGRRACLRRAGHDELPRALAPGLATCAYYTKDRLDRQSWRDGRGRGRLTSVELHAGPSADDGVLNGEEEGFLSLGEGQLRDLACD
jgi:hypothetical protein